MKVLLLTRYGRLGATSRIRFLQFLPYLQSHGIAVDVAPFLADDYVSSLYAGQRRRTTVFSAYARRLRQLTNMWGYDLLWVEKELLPWFPAFAERLAPAYVVDYDDAIFHTYDLHPNPLVRLLLGRKIPKVMARAAAVVAGNRYLADYARNCGARSVEYVPTVIDLERYPPFTDPQNGVFTIGWIGTPWTARYLPAIAPALQEVCRNGQARLILIGAGRITPPADFPFEVRAWSEESESFELSRLDCGIMPLPDEPYERGKCGYKLLQYMACGKPVVASPVGVNRDIVESGSTGYLAQTTAEWVRALNDLRTNPTRRTAMGLAARRKIEDEFSLAAYAPRIAEILRSARRNSHFRSP